jgi:NADH dehydrogenase
VSAWLVDRIYHGLAMPTSARKFRLFSGWFVELFTPRDLAAIVAMEHPRRAFLNAAEATTKHDAEKKTSAEK